jgi:EpsI family protein
VETAVRNSRFWTLAILLASSALVLFTRADSDLIPKSTPLSEIPNSIAGWSGSDLEISQQTLKLLGDGRFLSRAYQQDGKSSPIGLFVAYFPTQRSGVTIHSPKNCLPGSGWSFQWSHSVDLRDNAGKTHNVGEYIVANGENRQFVIYWYEAHGRSVASEYLAKLYLVTDAMRMNRTDGALVRVTTPIDPSEGELPAKARVEAFTAELAPMLHSFIPD